MLKRIIIEEIENFLNEEYREIADGKYLVNNKIVNIDFFIKKYNEWNNQNGNVSYQDPSKASVLEFLQNNYEDFSHDEKLKKDLLMTLTDMAVLTEDLNKEMVDVGDKQVSLNYIKQLWNNVNSKYTNDNFFKTIYNAAIKNKKLTPKQWYYLNFLFKNGKSPYEMGITPKNI